MKFNFKLKWPEMVILTKEFWDLWLQKFLTMFISVKVLGIIGIVWVSTWLLTHKYIDAGNWTVVVTTTVTTIFAVREIFKTEVLNGDLAKLKEKIYGIFGGNSQDEDQETTEGDNGSSAEVKEMGDNSGEPVQKISDTDA